MLGLIDKTIEKALQAKEGESIIIRGWVYRKRELNKKIFIVLRDETNIIQCVVDQEVVDKDTWNNANELFIESSCIIKGEIKIDKRAPNGKEVRVKEIKIISLGEPFPITKDLGEEFLLDNRHLWLRSRKMQAVMKIRSTILKASKEFFYKKGFYEVSPPIFTPAACEGGSTLFEVKYFNDKAYLSQSAQLYLETMIYSLGKVFSLTPSFRAEKSKTSRHLSEFWHLEPEIAWIDFDELLDLIEESIEYIIQRVLEENEKELKILGRDIEKLRKIKRPFPRITYDEAIKILKEKGVEIEWGKDLRTIEEEVLTKMYDKPLIVTKYPKKVKAFYMKEDPNNREVVLCVDVLAPEGNGEIVGGSIREEDIKEIEKRLIEEGEDIENYKWYLDLRRYGSIPHGGWGMGIDRVVKWICGLKSIKEAIPYPRTINRKYP